MQGARFLRARARVSRVVSGLQGGRTVSAEETYERVEAGRKWLAENNRGNANYIWYKAGIRKVSFKKGDKPEAVAELQARYDKWCKAFKMWLTLYEKLEREVEAEYPESAWKVD